MRLNKDTTGTYKGYSNVGGVVLASAQSTHTPSHPHPLKKRPFDYFFFLVRERAISVKVYASDISCTSLCELVLRVRVLKHIQALYALQKSLQSFLMTPFNLFSS